MFNGFRLKMCLIIKELGLIRDFQLTGATFGASVYE